MFVGGVFAAPALQQVIVTNFPVDSQGRLKVTPTNVTVAFPSQTSSMVVIPFNSTAANAIGLFPNLVLNSTAAGNVTVATRSLTLNLTQWREYRAYLQIGGLLARSVMTVQDTCVAVSQCYTPYLSIVGCFRLPNFGSAGSCSAFANFEIGLANQGMFTNSTGTFNNVGLSIGNPSTLDNLQGPLLDMIVIYNSVTVTDGLLKIATIGLGLYLRR